MSSVLNALYTIVIGPLELLFEAVFYTTNRFVTPGISIIILSFVLNILLIPLYNRAEEIQKQENDTQARLKPVVDHIKKSFKGDEQYMMLQTYYKINGYKPYYALRGSISLLIQIPFFIAAYSFLSNLSLLNGKSFGVIINLGEPDGLLFGINLLPILMTAINVVSCAIYTKGQPLKSKIQLYIMAVLFLVLLYNKPAGLSFYYLLNNLFSLIKNIINKAKNKKHILSSLVFAFGLSALIYCACFSSFTTRAKIIMISLLMIIEIINVGYVFNYKFSVSKVAKLTHSKETFFINAILIAVLLGLLIPSQLISESPEEFLDLSTLINPTNYVVNSLLLSIGTFVMWMGVYYSLMDNEGKILIESFLWIAIFVSLLDYLFFYKNLGNMSNTLIYDEFPVFSSKETVINIFCVVVAIVTFMMIYIKKQKQAKYISIVVCITIVIMSFINISKINKAIVPAQERLMANGKSSFNITLSEKGQNVVVFTLDRAINRFFPYIINEFPELKDKFSGFTYYPNTLSFGGFTNISTPSLYGGYEYTPEEMNKRNNELLKDKQNEALKVMPKIFGNEGYNVTICDPPYAGYSWIPDLSIYEDCKNVRAYNTDGAFGLGSLNKSLFFYSLSKSVPTPFFKTIYSNGNYFSLTSQYYSVFVSPYNVLQSLNHYTNINDSKGEVLIIHNNTTHEPVILEEPNYQMPSSGLPVTYNETTITKESINGEVITLLNEYQVSHYHVNAAAIIQIGDWLDYLKEKGVYDNTRIIICSDHGRDLGIYNNLILEDDDLMFYNPLLIVKDFNSNEFKTSNSLMTLADIPYLAIKDIVINPINPYTGNSITEADKQQEFRVFKSTNWNIMENNGTEFQTGSWYSVKNNCLDKENWALIK